MASGLKKGNKNSGRRAGKPGCLSKLVFYIFLIIAVTAAAIVFFKTKYVIIQGNNKYTSEEIRAASGISEGDSVIFINKIAVNRSILSKMPYVDEVSISRKFPDTIIINIIEAKPVACIKESGGYWLIDKKGKLLEKSGSEQPELIIIKGVTLSDPKAGKVADFGTEDSSKLRTLTDTLNWLDTLNMAGDVQSINLSYVYDVEMEYLNRLVVKLGMPESIDYKLRFLQKIVEENIEKNDSGYIDLTDLMDTGFARFIPDE